MVVFPIFVRIGGFFRLFGSLRAAIARACGGEGVLNGEEQSARALGCACYHEIFI